MKPTFKLPQLLFVLAIFGSVLIPGIFQAGVVPMELPGILQEFKLDDHTFGMLSGGIALACAMLGFTAIWVVPRLGAYRTCLLGYGIFFIGVLGITQFDYGPLALCFGIATGFGLAYLHLGNGLVIAIAPHRPAFMTNLLHIMNAAGKALGPAVSSIGVTWRMPFLAVGVIAVTVMTAGLFGKAPERKDALGTGPTEVLPANAPAREVLRQPFFWLAVSIFVLLVGMEQIVLFWLPKYLTKDLGTELGMDLVEAQRIALQAQSTLLGAELIGRLAAPLLFLLGMPPLLWLLFCTLATTGILIGTQTQDWQSPWTIAGIALTGLAFAGPWPTYFALVSRYFPRHIWLVSIASGGATTLGFIVFTAIGGWVGHFIGHGWTFRISPMLGFLAACGVLLVYREGERRLKHGPV